MNADYVCLTRNQAEGFLRQINDRWTPLESVVKLIGEALRVAIKHAEGPSPWTRGYDCDCPLHAHDGEALVEEMVRHIDGGDDAPQGL